MSLQVIDVAKARQLVAEGAILVDVREPGEHALGLPEGIANFCWGDDDLQSLNTRGLFPAGEGAGYAGGILSAGVDGIKVAEAVAKVVLAG